MQTRIQRTAFAADENNFYRQAPRIRILCITKIYGAAPCRMAWTRLLARSRSCEKIYQSPEFFDYLATSNCTGSDRFELFQVDDGEGQTLGILPLRWSSIDLDFKIGRFIFYTYRVRVIRLLGSLPLLEERDGLRNQVISDLLDLFPDQSAILMQSYPVEEKGSLESNKGLKFSLIHGWRTCHTIPLPKTFDLYLQKFSAKRKYNMAREVRRLKAQLGVLCLRKIDDPSDVAELFDCLTALSAPRERSVLNEKDYVIFAQSNICLSYTLRAGVEIVAAILGSRYEDRWHIHRIHLAEKYRHLSPGSVAMHLAIEDIIRNSSFTKIDFGFGEPAYKFTSTHLLRKRANVLVSQSSFRLNFVFTSFVVYDEFHSRLAKWITTVGKAIQSRRRSSRPGLGQTVKCLLINELRLKYGKSVIRRVIKWMAGNCWRFSPMNLYEKFEKIRFDRKHEVDTQIDVQLSELDIDSCNKLRGNRYHATPPVSFRYVLNRLNIKFSEYTFIDIGSGKGRTLILASEFGFRRIAGVEFGAELHQQAVRNLQHYNARHGGHGESIHMDATKFIFPSDPLVIYFFNPFDGVVLREVLENLASAAVSSNGRIFIVYLYLEHRDIFAKFTKFVPVFRWHKFDVFEYNRS